MKLSSLLRLVVLACAATTVMFAAATDGMISGKAPLKSAGPLAFGPEGVLFVGDSAGAQVIALDTNDRAVSGAVAPFEIKGINQKIAAMLGTTADQILVNDAVVNPISKKIYLSVSRGRGPDAMPVILRVDAEGKIAEVPLTNARFSTVAIADAPSEAKTRMQTITEVRYVDGKVLVAGLSNEEFSSNMRAIPYPFAQAAKGASIEIYHGSHGQFETNSPVRTFVPVTIKNQQYILAAYTCTPLVKIPVSELKAGAKVKGTTIAELGAGNRPLDMITYKKDGHDYILMANSSRGVMKVDAAHLETYSAITMPTEITGVPYKNVENWKGVVQLDKMDDQIAMVLQDSGGSLDLRGIALP
jgi:hypothetical protein